MADLIKLLGALGENADKLGTVGVLLLVIIGFAYALGKEKIVTVGQYKEKAQTAAEYKEALAKVNEELDRVKEALLRLQLEKEFTWGAVPKRTRRPPG